MTGANAWRRHHARVQSILQSDDKVKDIAKMKIKDLNTSNIESAMKIIAGTARSMGIEIGG